MRHNFYKTKICPFYIQGRCYKGDKCTYAHSELELSTMPDLSKTKLCANYPKGLCPYGNKCCFAHGEHELKATPDYYKTAPCIQFLSGHCKYGNRCRFAHGETELRPKLEPSPFVIKPKKQYKTQTNLIEKIPRQHGQQSCLFSEDPIKTESTNFFTTSNLCSWKQIYKPLVEPSTSTQAIDTFFELSSKEIPPMGFNSKPSNAYGEPPMVTSEVNLCTKEKHFYNNN